MTTFLVLLRRGAVALLEAGDWLEAGEWLEAEDWLEAEVWLEESDMPPWSYKDKVPRTLAFSVLCTVVYIGQPFLFFLAGGAVASLEAGDWLEEVAAVSYPLGATKIRYHVIRVCILCRFMYNHVYRTTFLELLTWGGGGITGSRGLAGRSGSGVVPPWSYKDKVPLW